MKDVSKNIALAALAAAVIGLSTLAFAQRLRLGAVETSPSAVGLQPPVVMPKESEKEETVASASGHCPRARVRKTYELNPDGSIKTSMYSVSVDGKIIAGSVVTSDFALIGSAPGSVLVSGDCKRVAWVERPSDEFDAKYEYGKAEKVRWALIGSEDIRETVLTKAGPAILEHLTADRLIVGLGPAVVGEADIPDEREFLLTYYAVESADGRITEVGGPFLAMSPDLRHRVRPEGKDVVLEDSVTKKAVVLAKGEKEYATNFSFSPDSRNLAYLRLTGDRDVIFAKLYRPVGEPEDFPGGALFVQPVDGGAPTKVLYGGYGDWWIERWLSPSKLEYSEPEMSKRIQEFDLAAPTQGSIKKGLIDQEAL